MTIPHVARRQRRGAPGVSIRSIVCCGVFLFALLLLGACSETTEPQEEPIVNPISTWAGVGGIAGFNGDGHDIAASWMSYPCDLEFTSSGCYVLDWNSHRVRLVTPQNTFQTVIGSDFVGDGDPDLNDRFAPGVPGTTVYLNHPTDIDELPGGLILLSAWHNHKLRIYNPSTGLVYVSCGAGAGFSGDGGPAENALLNQPAESIVGSDGSITILDQRNQRVRRIEADGTIRTVVGSGCAGSDCEGAYAGDGGPPTAARLNLPTGSNPWVGGGICVDDQNRLYIADMNNNRVRRVDFTLDVIETVAGNGVAGYSGDGGSAVDAMLNRPRDIEIGPDRRLYIVDKVNHRIRAVDLTTGIITTVVGDGVPRYAGDGGSATKASLYYPEGIAFDSAGDLYIADAYNQVIRKVDL